MVQTTFYFIYNKSIFYYNYYYFFLYFFFYIHLINRFFYISFLYLKNIYLNNTKLFINFILFSTNNILIGDLQEFKLLISEYNSNTFFVSNYKLFFINLNNLFSVDDSKVVINIKKNKDFYFIINCFLVDFNCNPFNLNFEYIVTKDLIQNDFIKYNNLDTFKFISSKSKYLFVDELKYFNNIDLNTNLYSKLNIYQYFSFRYGISYYTSKLLSKYLGFSYLYKCSEIPIYFITIKLPFFFLEHLKLLDNYLAEFILSRHSYLISLNSRKGLRLLNGYPIYGQRTRSNSKTASKFTYKLKFKTINK